MSKFDELRKKYPNFIYEDYTLEIIDNELVITYKFVIENLEKFEPIIKVPLNNIDINLNDSLLKKIIFNLGMVEVVSYLKCTCSKNVIIKAGYLNDEQISFFKKLYYNGLGEFLYLNKIDITIDELFDINSVAKEDKLESYAYSGVGNLIAIGGGKDSCVSLELLKDEHDTNTCFIINPKKVTLECAKVASYDEQRILGITRILDKKIISMNEKGFLNGHTPFSAIVAFSSYLTAYIYKKENIVLSNENSANEATVLGTNINHQYSKSIEFENDFRKYCQKFFGISLNYFSLLRPLTEFQIGMLFSNYKKFHQIFKSCNPGSKKEPWCWCTKCAKCLFVYIILSPFLYKDELIKIFGTDLFEDRELLDIFIELLGYGETKPFDCVGSYKEVRYAISLLIDKLDGNLPYLLQYYKDNYELDLSVDYKTLFEEENNVPNIYQEKIRKELVECAK